MKNMLCLSTLVLLTINVFCQKIESGSLSCLKGENQLNVVFDYSQCKIDGLSESDFIWKMSVEDSRGSGWEEYWKNECYRVFLGKFCLKAYEETQEIGLRLGPLPEAKYTAIFEIQSIDDDGEVWGKIRIVETEIGAEQAVVMKVNGDGGRWGSIENLIGDAMERAGEKFGKFLRKQINK